MRPESEISSGDDPLGTCQGGPFSHDGNEPHVVSSLCKNWRRKLFTDKNRPDPRHETTSFPNPSHEIPIIKVIGYKIRRRSDGLYSTGGGHPEFTHVGKTWSNKQGLHSHFAVIQEFKEYAMRRHKDDPIPDFVKEVYAGCDVVTLVEAQHIDIGFYRLMHAKKVQ